MGSCGSSLNCNKCYASKEILGCTTEIEIDPDIAGLGVLISFLLCAFGLSAVICWGYFNEYLPLDVLSRTDRYALQSLKKRRRPFVEADLRFEPTPKQKEKTQIIVGFVTVLSDQQLVTDVAILIAGLASRCHISFYGFNIVTCLAYFATFTHALSLRVLQSHLFARKLARDCRVVFTIGFLAIFGFSFIVNSVSSDIDDVIDRNKLNKGNVIQCLFEEPRFGQYVPFGIATSIVVLGLILANHTTAILGLYFEPEANPITRKIQLLCVYWLRHKGFSKEDAIAVLTKAESKHDAWLQPPLATDKRTRIPIWFFYEEYYNSYLSEIPQIMLGTTFGIGSVVNAVWYGGLKPANGLQILGFGQIVAMVLLALTLLAAVEVMSEQKHLKTHLANGKTLSVSEADVTESETAVENSEGTQNAAEVSQNSESVQPHRNKRFRWGGVCFGPPKSQEELTTIRADEFPTHGDDIYTARKMGNLALVYCCFETCFYTFLGIGYNFAGTGASASFFIVIIVVISIYGFYRGFLMARSLGHRIDFIRYEAQFARNQARPESQLGIFRQSNQSLETSAESSNASVRTTSPLPSRPVSVIEQRSTAREGQAEFGPPGRRDTEADIGLLPLARRRTNPPPTRK